MRTRVRKARCWLCEEPGCTFWRVTDSDGRLLYVTNSWTHAINRADEIACATVQPGTGDQVQNSE